MVLRNLAQSVKKKYFLDEEFAETLSPNRLYKEDEPQIEKEYIYESTGAKYLG